DIVMESVLAIVLAHAGDGSRARALIAHWPGRTDHWLSMAALVAVGDTADALDRLERAPHVPYLWAALRRPEFDALHGNPRYERVLAASWYPSATGQPAPLPHGYRPAPPRAEVERARDGVMGFLPRDLSRVHAHAMRNSDVSPQQPSYPVVILRAGASAEVWNYSSLAEDLASHGYVVVGFDAPYRTNVVVFPDGRVMRRRPENNPELVFGRPDSARRINTLLAAWTGDIAFVLDRLQQLNRGDASGKFTGRLDMSRVGVFGHSLGGATAAQFCHDDSRCKAGIDVDGAPLGSVIRDGIPRPFMFLLSEHGGSSDAESRPI